MGLLACGVFLFGCGGGVRRPSSPAANAPAHADEGRVPEGPPGVIHRVASGETLWAIAREYDLTVARIAEANDIADVDRIQVGQELLIPGATEIREVTTRHGHERMPGSSLAWPIRGEILSGYGERRRGHRHSGLDIRGKPGDLVTAAAAGTVVYASTMRGYGKTVILDHGAGVETLYAHARDLLVRVGDRVSSGDAIARVGRTGNATTEHCHFEVRRDDVAVDPLRYLAR